MSKSEVQLDGYDLYWNLASDHVGRGVGIYTKQTLQTAELPCEFYREAVWITIMTQDSPLLVGGLYRSPSMRDPTSNKDMYREIEIKCKNHTGPIVIAGDFNFPKIRWSEGTGYSTSITRSASSEEDFLQSIDTCLLHQHVTEATRYRENQMANILDLVFTDEDTEIDYLKSHSPLGNSDHQILDFSVKIRVKTDEQAQYRLDWNKGNYDEIRRSLQGLNWESELEHLNTQESWDLYHTSIQDAIKQHIPLKQIRGGKPPWITSKVQRAINNRNSAWKKYKYCRKPENWEVYKEKRNQATTTIRSSKAHHERNIALNMKTNPKAFWRFVKSTTGTRESDSILQKTDGTSAIEDEDKAEVLNQFFSSVFTEEREELPHAVQQTSSLLDDMTFTEETVSKYIKKLKVDKAAGPDDIPPRILQETQLESSKILSIIFNKSMQEGRLPSVWKDARVTPIYKKGSRQDPGNYRPVSLTSIVCKLMEQGVKERIMEFMKNNSLWSPEQYGFRPGRSCQLQLLEVLELWYKALDDGKKVDVNFLDFAKAFDSVPHRRLILKMKMYGIDGKIARWVRAFLAKRRQAVVVNGSSSGWTEVLSGVPQGSVLGPTLFLLYVNDLPSTIQNIARLFADDTKVSMIYLREEECISLQDDLYALEDWAEKWQLRFHPSKCKTMHIGKPPGSHTYTMHAAGKKIPLADVEEEKDLGVVIDSQLEFRKHVATTVSKAKKLAYLVTRNFKHLDSKSFCTLYKAFVRPVVEYASPVWSPQHRQEIERLESIQRQMTKRVRAVRKLPYTERLRELGLPTLQYRRERADMVQVYKVMHGIDDIDPRALFTLDTSAKTRGHTKKITKEHCKTTKRQSTFKFRVVNNWNSLPEEVVSAKSLNVFKSGLNEAWKHRLTKF